jgi:hypothetical protein
MVIRGNCDKQPRYRKEVATRIDLLSSRSDTTAATPAESMSVRDDARYYNDSETAERSPLPLEVSATPADHGPERRSMADGAAPQRALPH